MDTDRSTAATCRCNGMRHSCSARAPTHPGVGRQRMRRRTNPQQIHGGELAILVVAILNKAFRPPPVRQQLAIPVGHPWEVVAAVEQRGQVANLCVFVKVLAAGQCAGQQPDRIAGRNLHVFPALPGMDVDEVIEPAVDALHLAARITAQRPSRAVLRLLARNPFPLRADAPGGQAKSGHAGAAARLISLFQVVLSIAVNQIAADAGLRVARVLKITKAPLGKIVEHGVIAVFPRPTEPA